MKDAHRRTLELKRRVGAFKMAANIIIEPELSGGDCPCENQADERLGNRSDLVAGKIGRRAGTLINHAEIVEMHLAVAEDADR